MRLNFKSRPKISLFLIILLAGFMLINAAIAQELSEESQSAAATEEIRDGTRIIISTSGPAEFSSHWLDGPPRLVVEFQTRNILSKIGKEVIVNRGVIKSITSSYFGEGKDRSLKLLTFELTDKVPYRIWQEDNAILLDIQTPLEASVFTVGGREGLVGDETKDVIVKRLDAMDTALMQVAEIQPQPLEPFVYVEIVKGAISDEIGKVEEQVIQSEAEILPIVAPEILPTEEKKTIWGVALWLIRVALISGLGFLVWRRHRSQANQKLEKLKSELEEKNKRIEQEETVRKAVEKASLEKEKEYKKLQSQLQDKDSRLKEEEDVREIAEKILLEKEKEYKELKGSYDSLEAILVKKDLAKKVLSSEGEVKLWIPGKSQERRALPRLSLTKDFNKTVILRIESPNQPHIRSLANNISSGGLSFAAKKDFEEKKPINLRLFFYGDKVPMIKTQARIMWRRTVGDINYYGVSFEFIDEKDRIKLSNYLESKISQAPEVMVEV